MLATQFTLGAVPQPNRLLTGNSRKAMVASVAASPRRLKTDRIDLYWAQGEKGRAEGFGGRVFQAEDSPQRTRVLDTVMAIAEELGVTPGQVAIAWASTHGSVPIIGPRAAGQLDDYLAAARVTLSAQQLTRLDAVSALPGAPAARSPAHPVA